MSYRFCLLCRSYFFPIISSERSDEKFLYVNTFLVGDSSAYGFGMTGGIPHVRIGFAKSLTLNGMTEKRKDKSEGIFTGTLKNGVWCILFLRAFEKVRKERL